MKAKRDILADFCKDLLIIWCRFVKRSVDQKEESKEKRDLLLLNSVGSTFVRPAMVNRVVQPIQTFVSPVQVQQVGLGTNFVGNGMRIL